MCVGVLGTLRWCVGFVDEMVHDLNLDTSKENSHIADQRPFLAKRGAIVGGLLRGGGRER